MSNSYKTLATLHPAAILRKYEDKPLLDFDLKRARQEGTTRSLVLPERNLRVDLPVDEILHRLDVIIETNQTISIDLEGYWNNLKCISIAKSPWEGFVINFDGND